MEEHTTEKTGGVSESVAREEVQAWLDAKNYPQKKREANNDQIEAIEEAIADGHLVLNEDKTFKQTLLNPLEDNEGNVTLTSLDYKLRVNWAQVEPYMKNVKPTDSFGIINAHIAALTGKGTGIVKKLDSVDLNLARSIATFFL